MPKSSYCTIPNLFTLSRIIFLIILWFLFFKQATQVIGILLIFSFLTDFLDGFLARRLNQATPFGAKFDSIADHLTNLSIIIWLPFLLTQMFQDNIIVISTTVGLAVLSTIAIAIKYKKYPDLHLISNKISQALAGIFIIYALIFSYNQTFLYLACLASLYASLEQIAILLTHSKVGDNLKSFFHKTN